MSGRKYYHHRQAKLYKTGHTATKWFLIGSKYTSTINKTNFVINFVKNPLLQNQLQLICNLPIKKKVATMIYIPAQPLITSQQIISVHTNQTNEHCLLVKNHKAWNTKKKIKTYNEL